MDSNNKHISPQSKSLLDIQGNYQAKLWLTCYQEEREKNQILREKIAELTNKKGKKN